MGNRYSIIWNHHCTSHNEDKWSEPFNDLKEFPPEIALSILSNLSATDLCLASCVWQDLAEDDVLWKELCYSRWKYTTVYNDTTPALREGLRFMKKPVFKSLYMLLDEASLIYSFRPHDGISYLIDNHVITCEPFEIAKFLHGTSALCRKSTQTFLKERVDVLDEFVQLQQFSDVPLCDSLREYFSKIHPPERGDFLELLVTKFADRFYESNPECGFEKENISLLCYSLLLLSVDLYSPHVKNKMSKREFIRNNRQVMTDVNTDILSDMYDDVYLSGHVVPSCRSKSGNYRTTHASKFPFHRPYGAMFEFNPNRPNETQLSLMKYL